jgi:tetratricopeptide (TPR) repeat protein/predicted Ser/Thr protein kinase
MPSLHERAKDLFLEALTFSGKERVRFVAERCGEDTALLAEVESLLQFHDDTGESLQRTTGAASSHGTPDTFQPGDIFAKRYRMISCLGRGGLGDVWRADDLTLGTPVALKLIHATGPDAKRHIINEVRQARQITHPAICRVFDAGEDAGQVFLSMELVQGEDLATLLRRVGRLPSEKVIDIARQLCEGLAAAHAQGVLHRDLKPANVLIDDDGRVHVIDFGIAAPQRDGTRTVTGTHYLAPEQLTLAGPVTERTDVYAIGLILYELLVGQAPFARGSSSPPPPSSRVADVHPRLEQAILRALAPDPKHRPASASELAALLPTSPVDSARRSRVWLYGAAAIAIALFSAVAFSFMWPRHSRALTEQDSIVLADFTNTTGDPVFQGTLKVALAVALEQSPFLKVFPDERMRETLRLMGRAPDEAITVDLAREIAQRDQVKALIGGSIARLGRNFVLALEAVNAETGDVMAREQVEATRQEDVLTALGTAVSRLREKLGESLASIRRFDVPLARATTPSLEALHAYSLALDEGRVNLRLEAIPHLRRALELDPQFALALALMATVYSNNGQSALASDYAKKAFDLRDRVSERERFIVSFRYYRDAAQDWEKALEVCQLWTQSYPRESFAFNSLGASLITLGRWEEAGRALQRAIELDPKFATSYGNLAAVQMITNHPAEAKSVLQRAAAQGIDSLLTRRISYLLAFMDGDRAAMARLFEASIGVGLTNAAYSWEARSAAFEGRINAAHDHFRLGVQMSLQGSFQEVASQSALGDAEVHAIVHQCPDALKEVSEGLTLGRDNFALERASRVLALCGRFDEAMALVREMSDRFPQATMTMRVGVPLTTATIALGRGDARRALDILEPMRVYDHAPRGEYWIAYLRGQAHLAVKDGRAAQEDFTSILANRGENPASPLYSLAQLGLARALALAGDTAGARDAYVRFLDIWKNADADLATLQDARREHDRLS